MNRSSRVLSSTLLTSLLAGSPACRPAAPAVAAPDVALGCPVLTAQPGEPYREELVAAASRTGFTVAGSGDLQLSRNASTPDATPPELAQVDEMVRLLATTPLAEKARPLRYEQALNDCQHRAHLAVAHILSLRPAWAVGKVLVQGHDQLGMAHNKIHWGFHIAPVVAAREGDHEVLLVLDPAVDDTRALRLAEWLAAVRRPGKREQPPTVALLPADRWQPIEGDQTFCDELDAAGAALRTFAGTYDRNKRLRGEFWREQMRVTKLDEARHQVSFAGTKWFHYPQSLHAQLSASLERGLYLNIRYRKVRLRSRYHYLHIFAVDGGTAPVAANRDRSSQALAAEVAGEAPRPSVSSSR